MSPSSGHPSTRWAAWQARIDDAAVARAVRAWGGDPASVELLADGINRVLAFAAPSGPAVLRLVHAELRGAAEVRAALRYQAHLHDAGAPVPEPLPAADGRPALLIDLSGRGGRVVASAQRRAPGRPLTEPLPDADADAGRLRAWGRALGRLHAAARGYRPPGRLRYGALADQWRRVGPALEETDAELARLHVALSGDLAALLRPPFPAGPVGLCHADARPGNLLLAESGELTVIDFDEPTRAPFGYDLARALLAFADRPPEQRRRLLTALLGGYRSARCAPDVAAGALPLLLRTRCLLMAGWTLGSGGPQSDEAARWHAWVRGHALEPVAWFV